MKRTIDCFLSNQKNTDFEDVKLIAKTLRVCINVLISCSIIV